MADFKACLNCGAEIRADAGFCRHCGSSDTDGWREDEDGIGEVDDFDYDDYVAENFPDSDFQTTTRPLWRIVAIVLLAIFLLGYLVIL